MRQKNSDMGQMQPLGQTITIAPKLEHGSNVSAWSDHNTRLNKRAHSLTAITGSEHNIRPNNLGEVQMQSLVPNTTFAQTIWARSKGNHWFRTQYSPKQFGQGPNAITGSEHNIRPNNLGEVQMQSLVPNTTFAQTTWARSKCNHWFRTQHSPKQLGQGPNAITWSDHDTHPNNLDGDKSK